MRFFISILFLLNMLFFAPIVHAEVLQGGVSAIDMLPSEFYGTWSVISTRIETNNEELFKERTSDIWILQRVGDEITLTNPTTRATATISIDEVKDNKAKFSRSGGNRFTQETESAEITINNDSFSGVDSLEMKKFSTDNKLLENNVVKYKLEGKKISGRNAILYQTIRE